MHAVPSGYLRPFADKTLGRQKPHVWRFSRNGECKSLSVRDASVHRDLYAVRRKDGTKDRRIETELLTLVDNDLPPVVNALASGSCPSDQEWRALSWFVSFQVIEDRMRSGFCEMKPAAVNSRCGPNSPHVRDASEVRCFFRDRRSYAAWTGRSAKMPHPSRSLLLTTPLQCGPITARSSRSEPGLTTRT